MNFWDTTLVTRKPVEVDAIEVPRGAISVICADGNARLKTVRRYLNKDEQLVQLMSAGGLHFVLALYRPSIYPLSSSV